MKVVTTNKLNRFWKKGIKPFIDLIANKFDKANLSNNLITTEEGFALDARQGAVLQGEIDEIYSNLSKLIIIKRFSATVPLTKDTVNVVRVPIDKIEGYEAYCLNFYVFSTGATVANFVTFDDDPYSARGHVYATSSYTDAGIRAQIMYIKK